MPRPAALPDNDPYAGRPGGGRRIRSDPFRKGTVMILATTTVENVDRFLEVFGTKGADKRALHGSKGSTVFRDPTEENRVWALFDWDEAGWAKFVSDPDGPADPQGSRTPRQARGRAAPRLLRRVRRRR